MDNKTNAQSIGQWIKSARKAVGKNQEWLGEHLGITKGNVSAWENGKHSPSPHQLAQISRLFGVPLPPQLTPVIGPSDPTRPAVNTMAGSDIQGVVPVISWVTAGQWTEVPNPYEPGIAEEWRPCPKKHGNRTFALRVRGISMENPGGKYSYSDGDIIFVDPARQPENGSRVIVQMEGNKEATFKQLVIEGDRQWLKALNPAWPEKIIEINGTATICGVIIGKWTDE